MSEANEGFVALLFAWPPAFVAIFIRSPMAPSCLNLLFTRFFLSAMETIAATCLNDFVNFGSLMNAMIIIGSKFSVKNTAVVAKRSRLSPAYSTGGSMTGVIMR